MFNLLLPLFLFAQTVTAAPAAIITKVNQSGHVPADYRFRETCEVFLRRVVVTREMAVSDSGKPVVMKKIIPITLSKEIYEIVGAASQQEFQASDTYICDAPTTEIDAQASGVASFPLYRSGSCSEPKGERAGGSSWQLRKIIDSFCPETFDPGGAIGTRRL